MRKTVAALLSVLWGAISLSGCNGADIRYQQVKTACMAPLPRHARSFLEDKMATGSLLTPECKAAVESVIGPKMLEDTFALAPAGFRDRFLESIAVIATMPMRLADDLSVFGAAPGMVPQAIACILQGQKYGGACLASQTSCPLGADDPDLVNCNFFHYVLDTVSRYRYGGDNEDLYGRNVIDSDLGATITVYNTYWQGSSPGTGLIMPVLRAAVLGHEAMHTLNRSHIRCGDEDCDPDLGGPYAFEIILLEAFMRGGWGEPSLDPLYPAVSTQDFYDVMRYSCWRLQDRVRRVPPEMSYYLTVRCGFTTPESWALALGLPWPHPAEPQPRWSRSEGSASRGMSCGN